MFKVKFTFTTSRETKLSNTAYSDKNAAIAAAKAGASWMKQNNQRGYTSVIPC